MWGGERKRDGRTVSSSPFLNLSKGLLEDFYVKKQDVFCFVTINQRLFLTADGDWWLGGREGGCRRVSCSGCRLEIPPRFQLGLTRHTKFW
jgi:hypothetical protein